MLFQDQVTGQIHDVPDQGMGYGAVGFPPLFPILAKLAPVVLPGIIDAVSGALRPQPQAQQLGYVPVNYGYADEDINGYGYGYAGAPVQQQIVYDGFGNPLGFGPLLNAIAPIARNVVSAVAPMAQQALRTIAPMAQQAVRAMAPLAQTAAQAITQAPQQIANTLNPLAQVAGQAIQSFVPQPGAPAPYPVPLPNLRFPLPAMRIPPGWHRPQFPQAAPRRAYMRCSIWPGQPGLAPIAATAPGMIPGAPVPGAPVPVPAVRRRRRRR